MTCGSGRKRTFGAISLLGATSDSDIFPGEGDSSVSSVLCPGEVEEGSEEPPAKRPIKRSGKPAKRVEKLQEVEPEDKSAKWLEQHLSLHSPDSLRKMRSELGGRKPKKSDLVALWYEVVW